MWCCSRDIYICRTAVLIFPVKTFSVLWRKNTFTLKKNTAKEEPTRRCGARRRQRALIARWETVWLSARFSCCCCTGWRVMTHTPMLLHLHRLPGHGNTGRAEGTLMGGPRRNVYLHLRARPPHLPRARSLSSTIYPECPRVFFLLLKAGIANVRSSVSVERKWELHLTTRQLWKQLLVHFTFNIWYILKYNLQTILKMHISWYWVIF